MPVSQPAVESAIKRLRQIPGFPKDSPELVVETLVDRCVNDEHLGSATNRLLEDFDFWPSPRNLFDLLRSTLPADTKPRFGCRKCDYTGFVQATLTVGDRTAPASAPCSCRLPPAADSDEWQPRVNDEGVAGPVAAQRSITSEWADKVAEDIARIAHSRALR